MSIIKRIAGRLVRDWSYRIFPHLRRFKTIKQGADTLVIGGTDSFAYYQERHGVIPTSDDLTVAPMSIPYMFKVVRNYHSYLKHQGKVLLLLHPYSLCVKHYNSTPNIDRDIRFYPILHNAMIENYNPSISEKWSRNIRPSSFKDIVAWLKMSFSHYSLIDEMNECLTVLRHNVGPSDSISEQLKIIIQDNVTILKDINEFAKEREYNVDIVIMKDFFKGQPIEKYAGILNEILFTSLKEANLEIKEWEK